ncbi:MAG: hypothetical protein IJ501_01020 [Bacilli bacterium]|nr:hypothetical protein [Bacilli bacterium]
MKTKNLTQEEIQILREIINNLIDNPGVDCLYLSLFEDLDNHKEIIYLNIITDTNFFLEKLFNNDEREYCLCIGKLNEVCQDYEKENIRISIRDPYDYNLTVRNSKEMASDYSLGNGIILFDKNNLYQEKQDIIKKYFRLGNNLITIENVNELLESKKILTR